MVYKTTVIVLAVSLLVGVAVGYGLTASLYTPQLETLRSELSQAQAEVQGLETELEASLGNRLSVTQGVFEELPRTLEDAKAVGWVPLGECVPNMGIHAAKVVDGKPDASLLLLFNSKGELTGVELESLNAQQSPPWEHLEQGHPGMEFEHWTLHIYFKDPATACG
jgi:hypothetical protein